MSNDTPPYLRRTMGPSTNWTQIPPPPTSRQADDLLIRFMISAAWPDLGGDRPDPTRCRLCEVLHRDGVLRAKEPCDCACHPVREYLTRIGRIDDFDEHWARKTQQQKRATQDAAE